MQGRLRNEKLVFALETECGHCGQPIKIEIDSELNYRVMDPGSGSLGSSDPLEPLIFSPQVDLHRLEPSIIDGF